MASFPRSFQALCGLFLAVFIVLVMPAAAQSTSGCNNGSGQGFDSGAPCFANNSDILDGRNSLLEVDDLVVNMVGPSPLPSFPPFTAGGNLLTTDSTITQQTLSGVANLIPATNVVTLRGRLFNVDHDQILSTAMTESLTGQLVPLVKLEGTLDASIPLPSASLLTVLNGSPTLYGATADFLGNGYDQMVVLGVESGKLNLQALAGYDPFIPGDGIIAGSAYTVLDGSPVLAVTAGVFVDPSAATPRPAAQLAVLTQGNNSLVVTFYSVDPTLNITLTGQQLTLTLPTNPAAILSPIAIAAGRFSGGTHDQLAIAYPVASGPSPLASVAITTVDFDQTAPNQGKAFQGASTNTGFQLSTAPSAGTLYSAVLYLAKGKFNWFGSSDQLAVSVGTDGKSAASIGVMSFDSSLNGTMGSSLILSPNTCHFGLVAGNFDSMQNGQPDPNLQLADVATACGLPTQVGPFNANIYNVDPETFAVTVLNTTSISNTVGFGPATGLGAQALSLVAGDEQARSLALGPPEEVVVPGHIQPDTILQLPPMHVDWIAPPSGGQPAIFNVSVFPSTYNSAYSFSDSSGGSVSRSATTSYTFGSKTSANEKISYGVPGLGGVSVQAQQAVSQLHQNTVAKKYNTYSGASTTFTLKTEFDDVVAATTTQFNIYSYRVLGQCVAGDGPSIEGCADGTVPLYVQFSGPDNVQYDDAELGAGLEWYQPVQEPGNIFSYPATADQFAGNLGGGTTLQTLSGTPSAWNPQVIQTVSSNWANNGSSSVSSGSTSSHTFDSSFSVSGNASFDGFGASASGSFDYNDSSSLSTLNQSTSTLSDSTGISLATGLSGSAINTNTIYQGQQLIYGQNPQTTFQTDATPATTVQASGFIASGYLVDMMSTGGTQSGLWWQQAYNVPDIALNHPARWAQNPPSGVNSQEVQFNCPYGYASVLSSPPTPCASATPTYEPPKGYQDDSFYQIKGLFITPGGTSNGPQIQSTTLGSTVNLRLRVYNYSVQNFPANSTLHVQFYAQPWASAQFVPNANDATQFAPAVFIGNGTTASGGTLTPPPAFCGGALNNGSDPCTTQSGDETSNWEFAYATWDTSKGGVTANSTWKFWAVVWVEDSNGNLVAELPGHGLTALPPANGQYNSLADVPIEIYSNNLGFYNQAFTVLPVPSLASTGSSSTASKQLKLGTIATRSGVSAMRYVPTTILAPHTASGDHIDSLITQYYDGSPKRGGTLFDTQQIPRVVPGQTYTDNALFRPKTCGLHHIFVRSIPTDGSAPVATATTTLKVTDNPVRLIEDLIHYVNAPSYPRRVRSEILLHLDEAKRAFADNRTQAGAREMQTLLRLVDCGDLRVPPETREALTTSIRDLLGCL
ncbi:hypothetical protein [Silvibacterium acidisoli]|uniref:hypothetical protein n=1 Tax=Acidobacteriaceae bacterium ZG23-2 TaxID=2883246 RepID=UPI00406CCCF3